MCSARGGFLLLLAITTLITGCEQRKPSQVITLYKGNIASGNSIVNFVDHNDPNGVWAQGFCEDMKKLYEAKWREKYYCAGVQYEEFIPEIKWMIAK